MTENNKVVHDLDQIIKNLEKVDHSSSEESSELLVSQILEVFRRSAKPLRPSDICGQFKTHPNKWYCDKLWNLRVQGRLEKGPSYGTYVYPTTQEA